MKKKLSEFDLIETYFAPLSKNFTGALALKDDAALLAGNRVVSTDGFAEDVHFRSIDSAYAVGEKIVRAALSDLAAMGATPECWFLTAAFGSRLASEVKEFARGCQRAQERYGIHLAGGDTLRVAAESFFSVTVVGYAATPVLRSGGRAGDRLYVSGTLGDSALGLRFPYDALLNARYLYPEPRLALGQRLPPLAHAAVDLSDGLVADLTHLCKASGCGALIYQDLLPISHAAFMAQGESAQRLALNAGDDYELLIAAPVAKEAALYQAAEQTKTALTCIGELTKSRRIKIKDTTGARHPLPPSGYRHF